MAPLAEFVWNDVQKLGEDDQHRLLGRLLDKLEPPDGIPVDAEDAFDAELLRRAEELRADPSQGIPWEQVREMR